MDLGSVAASMDANILSPLGYEQISKFYVNSKVKALAVEENKILLHGRDSYNLHANLVPTDRAAIFSADGLRCLAFDPRRRPIQLIMKSDGSMTSLESVPSWGDLFDAWFLGENINVSVWIKYIDDQKVALALRYDGNNNVIIDVEGHVCPMKRSKSADSFLDSNSSKCNIG